MPHQAGVPCSSSLLLCSTFACCHTTTVGPLSVVLWPEYGLEIFLHSTVFSPQTGNSNQVCVPPFCQLTIMLYSGFVVWSTSKDTLPEWSKGVDSSSTSASCVGSNPTGVNFVRAWQAAVLVGLLRPVLASAGPFPAHCMYPSTVVGRCCGAAELVFILSLCAESQGHFARVV